jgi:hypothetical protein
MTPPFDLTELRDLLDALCDERISVEQMRRLEELVLAHPEAEAFYVRYMSLYADLVGHFAVLPQLTEQALRERGGGARTPAPAAVSPKGRRGRGLSALGLLTVTGLAAGLVLGVMLWRREAVPPAPEGAGEAVDLTVAVLLRAPEAEWDDTDLPTWAGAPLPPGLLRLKSGYAHIEFYCGATVILQGPADFRLVSRTEAYCERGKLWATVPRQAQGFRIGSPRMDLIDRGTEFGLDVSGDRTEVHVFQGKVEWLPAGPGKKEPQALTTGRAMRLAGAGRARAILSNPTAFLTARGLAERTRAEAERRQQRWEDASRALRRDPDLVVYYPFQARDPWSRTLRDEAGGRKRPQDGVIVGCNWGTGRWPGKQALEFKRVSDRVRFHVPGEFTSLTLMAWLRVDALPNRFNSLFMTDAWDIGAPHWHISNAGRVALGIKGVRGQGHTDYTSPVLFGPDRLGQWAQLAVVYDADEGQVTHYLDGKPVAQIPVKFDIALHVGDVEVGNWNVASGRFRSPVRYFRGSIDEFLMFSRALSEREVERLYEQGKPPR